MKELKEFERIELISRYIDGVTTKEEKELVDKLLNKDDLFLETFVETYEFMEILRYISKESD